MEILGIGFGELLLIVLIILILFGPKEMVKTGRTLGQWLNRIMRSPTYQILTKTGQELKELPVKLMREANVEEYKKDFDEFGKETSQKTQAISADVRRSFPENQIFDPGSMTSQASKQEILEESPNDIGLPPTPKDGKD